MPTFSLSTPLTDVLGKAQAKKLYQTFGYENFSNLLNHAPRRYQSRGELTPLIGLSVGEVVTVFARVETVKERVSFDRKKRIFEVVIGDNINKMYLIWFNQPWRAKEIKPGMRGMFSGKVTKFRNSYQLAHPEFKMFSEEDEVNPIHGTLKAKQWSDIPIPIYPATAKIHSWDIHKAIKKVLQSLTDLEDPIPTATLKMLIDDNEAVMDLLRAYQSVHEPDAPGKWKPGLRSLKFREAFELQLGLLYRKQQILAIRGIPRPKISGGIIDRFDQKLPFKLTGDQQKVGETIAAEIADPAPMHRLLQGEVGSGKTLVALRAMLQVADTDGQAVLLAPTEVLATQHLRSITELLDDELLELTQPTLLTGQLTTKEKKSANLAIASGKAKIIVGTHALMSENVTFADLGLIVIDEQHRFGVDQRETLRLKAKLPPNVLVMTATPIPRTVALTAFGDLEISTLKEMPAGRARIESFTVPITEKPEWINRAWVRAAEEIEKGRQVYIVCPAINPKKTEGIENIENVYDLLQEAEQSPLWNVQETLETVRLHPLLKKYKSAALTGEMSAADKDKVMVDFAAGNTKILVATTVIEVGVNVPNASVMIVLDADRFGVSQLHQLRGRVGRGKHPGLCLFVTASETGTASRKRVEAVTATLDGFKLAQIDLEMRREGDILGSVQSGSGSSLKWLKVIDDLEVIEKAGEYAKKLITADPTLKTAQEYRKRFSEMAEINKIAQIHRS